MLVHPGGVVSSTVLAHLLTTGCALVLLRRGPNRRLRLLTLAVGLMSLSQTITLLQSAGMWTPGVYTNGEHEVLVGALSLLAIHLLGREIYDRNRTDMRLRLVEHETAGRDPVVRDQRIGGIASEPTIGLLPFAAAIGMSSQVSPDVAGPKPRVQ